MGLQSFPHSHPDEDGEDVDEEEEEGHGDDDEDDGGDGGLDPTPPNIVFWIAPEGRYKGRQVGRYFFGCESLGQNGRTNQPNH